jgi:hypothetical protein
VPDLQALRLHLARQDDLDECVGGVVHVVHVVRVVMVTSTAIRCELGAFVFVISCNSREKGSSIAIVIASN